MTQDARKEYEAPRVKVYGTLQELTAASNNFGNEDGGVKHTHGFGGTGTFS
jgi:hypothetical protein